MAYSDTDKDEIIKGVKFWKNPKNRFNVFMLHYSADPDKDPDRSGKDWYDNEKAGTLKATWLKEYEIDFSTKSGKLIFGPEYCDFDPKVHFINSFEFQNPVEQLISVDFGQRNATAGLVGIWTMDERLYIVDEYYKPAIPSVSSREMFTKFEYLMGGDMEGKTPREKRNLAQQYFGVRVIDPTTASKNRTKVRDGEEIAYSVIEEFYDNGWDFETGQNDWQSGITRLREYFKIDNQGKSNIYIFKDKCPNLCWELQKYRYKENTETQDRTRNAPEEPVKKDDHAVDSLRYLIMTRPNTPQVKPREKTMIEKDIENLLKPRINIDYN